MNLKQNKEVLIVSGPEGITEEKFQIMSKKIKKDVRKAYGKKHKVLVLRYGTYINR